MKDGSLSVKNNVFEDNTALKVSSNANPFPSLGENKIDKSLNVLQSGGALFFDSVKNVSIADSKFIDNNSNSAGLLTGGGGAITSFLGKISLTNTVFKNNTGSNGFDIWVEDDTDPATFGSFITCNRNVVFCNGVVGYEEFVNDDNLFYLNGNCLATGIRGSPGQGPC